MTMGKAEWAVTYVKPFGTIFLNLLKFIVVPIVLSSIITGVISMKDIKKVGAIGGKTVLYYMMTTAFAVVIGLTFANVLRSILRQDPNIIMIGEIRDTETAQIAVRASITGHLVLSTLHTNNSLNTIERLLDMNVERYLLGSALTGIISQKLARQLCNNCKRKRPTIQYEKELFKKVLNKDVEEIYVPGVCPECNGGYRGRNAIQEVLLINEDIRDAIANNVRKEELRKLVYEKSDTTTLLQDGLNKVIEGKTSLEEVLKLIELDDSMGIFESEQIGQAISQKNIDEEQVINSDFDFSHITSGEIHNDIEPIELNIDLDNPVEILDI